MSMFTCCVTRALGGSQRFPTINAVLNIRRVSVRGEARGAQLVTVMRHSVNGV
jgi:hypothetical protein